MKTRGEAELLEGDLGQIEPAGAAGLGLAVDVVDILVGRGRDPSLGLGQQRVAVAELEGVGRTGLGAGRGLKALLKPP